MSRKYLPSGLVSIPKQGRKNRNVPHKHLRRVASTAMSDVTDGRENKKEQIKKPQPGHTRFSLVDEEEKEDQICPGTIKKLTGEDKIGKEKIEEEFNAILKHIFREGDHHRTPMYSQKATLGAIIPCTKLTSEDIPPTSTSVPEDEGGK